MRLKLLVVMGQIMENKETGDRMVPLQLYGQVAPEEVIDLFNSMDMPPILLVETVSQEPQKK
jgi:hypothetical protein